MAIVAGIVSALTRFGILTGVLFVSVMRIDVNSMPEWFTNIMYLDNFNKSYYASILTQHIHNNPIMMTFKELLFMITKPVNSDKNLEVDDRIDKNRRKKIRNRFHLWVFLHKNPSFQEFRHSEMQSTSLEDERKDNEDNNSSGEGSNIQDYSGDNLGQLVKEHYKDQHKEENKQNKKYSDEFSQESEDEEEEDKDDNQEQDQEDHGRINYSEYSQSFAK